LYLYSLIAANYTYIVIFVDINGDIGKPFFSNFINAFFILKEKR